jgi:hypothetical protein
MVFRFIEVTSMLKVDPVGRGGGHHRVVKSAHEHRTSSGFAPAERGRVIIALEICTTAFPGT